jgi:AcrR family transcriptional regulator
MTRTKPAEQRRAELLAAGQALFGAKGIAATSLEDIAQRAGVSKGLFYLYFHSKEDLVLALQEQFSHQVAARMRAAADSQADWTAKLDACVQASFEYHRDLHDLHEVLFHHAIPVGQRAHPAHALLTGVIQDLLQAGTAAGAFDAAATVQTTPGSSGPRGNCSGAPRGWRERAGPATRGCSTRHAGEIAERPAKMPWHTHSRRPGWGIITILLRNTG